MTEEKPTPEYGPEDPDRSKRPLPARAIVLVILSPVLLYLGGAAFDDWYNAINFNPEYPRPEFMISFWVIGVLWVWILYRAIKLRPR